MGRNATKLIGPQQSPRIFSDELKRMAPLLRAQGILVKFQRTKIARLITIDADPSVDHSIGPHFTGAIRLAE